MESRTRKGSSYQFHLFATRADYELVIKYCEQKATLKYARFGDSEADKPEVFYSALDIPNFGASLNGKSSLDGRLVVTYRDIEILVRKCETYDGGIRHIVDQMINPISIVFQPGGLFEERAIIQGEVSTLAEDKRAVELFRLFARSFRTFFISASSFWLGPEAVQRLKAGCRLTPSIGRTPAFDFKVEWLPPSVR